MARRSAQTIADKQKADDEALRIRMEKAYQNVLEKAEQKAMSIDTTINHKKVIYQAGDIKATFDLTPNKLKILQAMEKQKAQEKLQGKSAWQINQDKLNEAKRKIELAKQKTQEFRNRTKEQILQNFIRVQLEKERTQDLGTNFTEYAKQEGFDPNKPEEIPITIFQPTKLDTPEKLLEAGVASSLVNVVLESKLPTFNGTPVNYAGLQTKVTTHKVTETNFVPQIQHEVHKPVGMDLQTVKTTPITTTQVVAQTKSNIESSGIKLALPLMIGLFIL